MMKKQRVGVIGYGHLGEFLVSELNRLDDFQVIRIWNRTPNNERGILPLEAITVQHLRDIDLIVEVAHPAIIFQYVDVILDNCDLFVKEVTSILLIDIFLITTVILVINACQVSESYSRRRFSYKFTTSKSSNTQLLENGAKADPNDGKSWPYILPMCSIFIACHSFSFLLYFENILW
ncbi:homoserine dehydrogenase, NAD binding domain protein [Dictyocaulus viviparus]|uniref:Homoserine dehydrogenase, NAD binding domain protein n=1 Tax=Dictyocaulus viviparus TaxID=29172 RepID=A0A0D8XUQ6_DICVI|nr:homoserine dehydrogenase, NAD binding domain protein [Dictyocaulus viviparus]